MVEEWTGRHGTVVRTFLISSRARSTSTSAGKFSDINSVMELDGLMTRITKPTFGGLIPVLSENIFWVVPWTLFDNQHSFLFDVLNILFIVYGLKIFN